LWVIFLPKGHAALHPYSNAAVPVAADRHFVAFVPISAFNHTLSTVGAWSWRSNGGNDAIVVCGGRQNATSRRGCAPKDAASKAPGTNSPPGPVVGGYWSWVPVICANSLHTGHHGSAYYRSSARHDSHCFGDALAFIALKPPARPRRIVASAKVPGPHERRGPLGKLLEAN